MRRLFRFLFRPLPSASLSAFSASCVAYWLDWSTAEVVGIGLGAAFGSLSVDALFKLMDRRKTRRGESGVQ